MQANDYLKNKFKEGLIEFYNFLPKTDFPKMKDFACRYISLFGTRMKYVKNRLRSNMTDKHMESILLIGTSNLKPELTARVLRVLEDLWLSITYPVPLYEDNQSTMKVAEDSKDIKRLKHVDTILCAKILKFNLFMTNCIDIFIL